MAALMPRVCEVDARRASSDKFYARRFEHYLVKSRLLLPREPRAPPTGLAAVLALPPPAAANGEPHARRREIRRGENAGDERIDGRHAGFSRF